MSELDALNELRTASAPYAYDLARVASAAGFVNPALLRHLRRHVLPDDADARAEASVWWSGIVEHRGVNGLTFHPAALDVLRGELAGDRQRDAAIDAVERLHAGGPALLVLEEQLVALSLRGAAAEELEARLAAAVAALDDAARAGEVYSWAERSLHRLPPRVRATTAAWALALAVQGKLGLELSFDGGDGSSDALRWQDLAHWLPSGADAELVIYVRDGEVVAEARESLPLPPPLPLALDAHTIAVPPTNPRVVLVGDGGAAYRAVRIPHGESTSLGPASSIRSLANLRGDVWAVTFRDTTPRPSEPSTLVRGNGMTVRIHGGDAVALLAFEVDAERRRELLGFALHRDGTLLSTSGAPELMQRSWCIDHAPAGIHRYTVAAIFAGAERTTIDVPTHTSGRSGSITVGFTRSRASVEVPGEEPVLRPSRSTELEFDTAPFRTVYESTGGNAFQLLCAFLDECIRDEHSTLDVFAHHLDHPDVLGRFASLGHRLRIVLDDSKTHARSYPQLEALLRRAGCHVAGYHYRGLCHNKVLIRSVDGVPRSVLTGSANWSLHSLHAQHNYVVRIDDSGVAQCYGDYFRAAWQKRLSGLLHYPAGVLDVLLSPSPSLIDSVIREIEAATSSILFSLFDTPSNRVLEAVERARKRGDVMVAGVINRARSARVVRGTDVGFVELPGSMTSTGHGRFLVVDFNRTSAAAIVGSSTYSATSERSGENVLVIRDRAVATMFAIEALDVVDRLWSRASAEAGVARGVSGRWWHEYYHPRSPLSRMRELLVDTATPAPATAEPPTDEPISAETQHAKPQRAKPRTAKPPPAKARPVKPQRSVERRPVERRTLGAPLRAAAKKK